MMTGIGRFRSRYGNTHSHGPFGPVPRYFQPYGTSGVNPFTTKNEHGVSRFDLVSNRIYGHDIYDDNVNNGSVFYQAYFNPQGSGNQGILKAPGGPETMNYLLYHDLYGDGRVNGDSIKTAFGLGYQKATGHNILPALNRYQNPSAPRDWRFIMRNNPDPRTPEGLDRFLNKSKLTDRQDIAFAAWGHDWQDDGKINGSTLRSALNDPSSLDYPLVNHVNGGRSYVNSLLNQRNPGQALNRDFLNAVFSLHQPHYGGYRWG